MAMLLRRRRGRGFASVRRMRNTSAGLAGSK
jgi:hypothetical protein